MKKSKKTEPKKVLVETENFSGEFDELVAPLVKNIWLLDLDILGCGYSPLLKDHLAITFESVIDAEIFLNACAPRQDLKSNSLYNKIIRGGTGDDSGVNWKFSFFLQDLPNSDSEEETKEVFYRFASIIQFPIKDLKLVNSRLEKSFKEFENKQKETQDVPPETNEFVFPPKVINLKDLN